MDGASTAVPEILAAGSGTPWVLPGFSAWSAGLMAVAAGLVFGLVMGGLYLFRQNYLHPQDSSGEDE